MRDGFTRVQPSTVASALKDRAVELGNPFSLSACPKLLVLSPVGEAMAERQQQHGVPVDLLRGAATGLTDPKISANLNSPIS